MTNDIFSSVAPQDNRDYATKVLSALSALAPRDQTAINPATTEAMAKSRDSITTLLNKQMSRLDSPFQGLQDVAAAGATALTNRTPPTMTLEALDQNRISKAGQIANTLSQVASREANVGSKMDMTPFQRGTLLLQGVKTAAAQGNQEAKLVEQFYDNAAAKLDNQSALTFMNDWHSVTDALEKQTGRKLSAQESIEMGRRLLQSGPYKAKQPESFIERATATLADFRERQRNGQQLSPRELDVMSALDTALTRLVPVGEGGLAARSPMAPMQTGNNQSSFSPNPNNPIGPQLASIAQRYGIDPSMLDRVAQIESNYNPTAQNPKSGASGMFQFMPSTAQGLGLSDPTDPLASADAAAKYLSQLRQQFGGNDKLALMAYNWGPANVQNWLQNGADPNRVPQETRDYLFRYENPGRGYQRTPTIAQAGQDRTATMPSNMNMVVQAKPKPLPAAAQDDAQSISIFANAMPDLEEGIKDSAIGIGKGYEWAAPYTSGQEWDKTRKFVAAKNALRVQAQSIIKGTPSNFDVQTVIAMFPDLGNSRESNEQKIRYLKSAFADAWKIKIGVYLGLGYSIPQSVWEAAGKLGISQNDIRQISEDEGRRLAEAWNQVYREQAGSLAASGAKNSELKKKYGLE